MKIKNKKQIATIITTTCNIVTNGMKETNVTHIPPPPSISHTHAHNFERKGKGMHGGRVISMALMPIVHLQNKDNECNKVLFVQSSKTLLQK